MLLFGGTLSVPGPPASKADASPNPATNAATAGTTESPKNAERRGDPAAHSLSPHSDVLHRLMNHELRLLEELERTRSKLQAEWRLKLADLQRQQPDAVSVINVTLPSPSTVDEMAQRLSIPRELVEGSSVAKAAVSSPNQRSPKFQPHKKSRWKQEQSSKQNAAPGSLPRILRSTQDMMPILTTTGETPFEVGLAPVGSESQHVLPIFRLPSVNVNGAARALATTAVETIQEDRDRKLASEALGLSLDEIEQLEAKLNGREEDAANSHYTNQVVTGRDVSYAPKQQQTQQNAAPRKKMRERGGRQSAANRKTKHGRELSRSDSLRSELESALYNVQHLTRLVKIDITSAQKICPASELRTTLYFKRWGREKVNIFRWLLYNLQGVAMERWKRAVAHEKQQEKMQAYLMYKGSKKLDMFLLNWSQRKLRQAWTKWWSDYAHQKALERVALELESIQIMQRAWRGYRGRMFFRLVKEQRLFARQTAAAVKLQHSFRGSIARKFLRLKRLNKRRQMMATRIQAAARRYLARRLVASMRREQQVHIAASKVQALYRGRKVRRQMERYRQVRRLESAAIRIQRRYRGRLGRAKYIRRQIERHRDRAAIIIQTKVRGWLARRLLKRLREEDRKERAQRHAAAISIQKVYRGHRTRLATELKLVALREKNKWRAQAATKIQKLARCRQAKKKVEKLRRERFTELVTQARRWVEYWNEDSAKWFYYNQETGEALWAPPSTGYTKVTGQLVLQDGRVIEDPGDDVEAVVEAPTIGKGGVSIDGKSLVEPDEDEGEESDDEDKLCIECEEEDARRKCGQCEDFFCDACFEKLHQSAKRRQHTWKAVGSTRCIECEKMKATRWCEECQDPYCLGCFTIIHSKGNKSAHKWVDMAAFKKASKLREQQHQQAEGENAQTYDEYMRSAEYQYVTEVAEEVDDWQPPDATASVWVQLLDAASGLPYYYNSLTGESRWA